MSTEPDRYIPASILQRLGALMVDVLLFIVTVMVPATLISWWFGPEDFSSCEFVGNVERCSTDPDALRFTRTVAYSLAALWIPAYALAITTGASIGKRATETRVVDASTGETIGFARALARTLIAVVGLGFFGLGMIVALTNRQRRALHDFATGSRLISP